MNNMFNVKPNVCGLRRSMNLVQPKYRTVKYGKLSFEYIGSHIWNLLPHNFHNANNISHFKKLIKSWKGPTCQCNICSITCSL